MSALLLSPALIPGQGDQLDLQEDAGDGVDVGLGPAPADGPGVYPVAVVRAVLGPAGRPDEAGRAGEPRLLCRAEPQHSHVVIVPDTSLAGAVTVRSDIISDHSHHMTDV